MLGKKKRKYVIEGESRGCVGMPWRGVYAAWEVLSSSMGQIFWVPQGRFFFLGVLFSFFGSKVDAVFDLNAPRGLFFLFFLRKNRWPAAQRKFFGRFLAFLEVHKMPPPLSAQKINKIRRLLAKKTLSLNAIAQQVPCSPQMVSKVKCHGASKAFSRERKVRKGIAKIRALKPRKKVIGARCLAAVTGLTPKSIKGVIKRVEIKGRKRVFPPYPFGHIPHMQRAHQGGTPGTSQGWGYR